QKIIGYNGTAPIYFPYPSDINAGYNCSPANPYFVGWQNIYSVVDTVLQKAQSRSLEVNELDIMQELDLQDFTVLGRFISDNKHGIPGDLDVFDKLRYYMGIH